MVAVAVFIDVGEDVDASVAGRANCEIPDSVSHLSGQHGKLVECLGGHFGTWRCRMFSMSLFVAHEMLILQLGKVK